MKSLFDERRLHLLAGLLAFFATPLALAAPGAEGPSLVGIPVNFILFAATLLGVALFHHHVLKVALTGLATISIYKILFTGFKAGTGLAGFGLHMAHEWVLLANLLGLLVGFALLARHFEDSGVPEVLPKLLPEGWLGPFVLLVIIFVLSELPRQHRRRADRRHGRRQRLQAQGAYRLPGGHRRRLQWGWCRLGGRRHDDDHDVA